MDFYPHRWLGAFYQVGHPIHLQPSAVLGTEWVSRAIPGCRQVAFQANPKVAPVMRGPVPNAFPSRESACRVALIGEAPGETECSTGLPFSGTAGWALNTALSWAGLSREECFIGNVCQWKPSATSNEFDLLDWAGEEVQSGITQLLLDLASYRPNVVVCLGNVPLHLFRHGNVPPPRGGAKEGKVAAIKWPSKVSAWRGSLFTASPLLAPTISPPPQAPCPPLAPATPPLLPGLPPGVTPTGLLSPEERSEAHHNLTCGVPTGGVDAATDTAPDPALPPDCASGGRVGLSFGSAGIQGPLEDAERSMDGTHIRCLPALPTFKVLSTWHPAYVLRSWSSMFDLRQDLVRARLEAVSPVLVLPVLALSWGPDPALNA